MRKRIVIGRGSDSDLVVSDGSVSRRHAELISSGPEHFLIADCGSSRGTFVLRDGQWTAVIQEELGPDQPFRLGDVQFTPRVLMPFFSGGGGVLGEHGGLGGGGLIAKERARLDGPLRWNRDKGCVEQVSNVAPDAPHKHR